MEKSNKEFINETSNNIDESRKIVDNKDDEIKRLNELLSLKEQTIQYITMTEEQYKQKCSFYSDLCSAKDAEIENLKAKIIDSQKQMEEKDLRQKSEGLLMIEVEQLKKDKERLLTLLRDTKEYKKFAEFAEDSNGVVSKDEQWIPEEVNKVVLNYFKLGGNVSQDIISQLLKDLNALFSEREKKQINRLKAKYLAEIATLKRRLVSRMPFDGVIAKKQISKLKSDLKNVSTSEKRPTAAFASLEEALKMVALLESKVAELEEQNSSLQAKINATTAPSETNEYVLKAKFMEGSEWMCKRVLEEIGVMMNAADGIIQEYNTRTKEKDTQSSIDIIYLARTQSWLLVLR